MYKASCLCGEIVLEFKRIVGDYVYCHCRSCQKSSGSAFAANISVPIDDFKIIMGEDLIGIYESTPGKKRHFCSQCASPLFTKVGARPAAVRVRLGCLDTEFRQTTSAHIFVNDKASWEKIEDSIPEFEQWPSSDEVRIYGSHQPDE